MVASFTIIPIGDGEELKEKIAEIIAIIDESGIDYKLGAMQTTLEGSWEDVMKVISRCHNKILETSNRCLTSITIDDRKDAVNRLDGKVQDVVDILSNRSINVE